MKVIVNFFKSVKLAIFLIIIITCASILGTLIPQNRPPDEYTARYGQLAELFDRLQFTNLYHSWWFIALLSFLSLNIIICTLSRLFPKFRKAFRPKLDFDPDKMNALKIKDKFRKDWILPKAKEYIRKELANRHFRLKEKQKGNRIYLLARKKLLGLFGTDFVHLGLLVIIIGGIVSGFAGLRANINISEGQILPVPKANFKLRLDKFETELYPNGNVRDWKSTLTIMEEGKPRVSKTIEVNHPLTYKGYAFYQSSYGWNWENPLLEIWVKKKKEPSFLQKIKLKIGEKSSLEDEGISFTILHFIPDFVINENNEIATRSLEPHNPAAFIEGWQGDEKIFSGWIFAKFPNFSRIHSQKETDLSFEFKNIEAANFSGIQVSKDPGVNIIWIGSALLMIGLALAFYWPAREIMVVLEDIQGKTEVTTGGVASKNREAFQSMFRSIMNSIRRLG